MPVISRTFLISSREPPRLSLLHPPRLRALSTSSRVLREGPFRRADFDGQGFTSTYEPGKPTEGPLSQASKHGVPTLTPFALKAYLDKFVVGQDKAKKVTCVATYNHYQRIREIRRQEAEEQKRRDQEARRHSWENERRSHPVEDEFPGHTVQTANLNSPFPSYSEEHSDPVPPPPGQTPLSDLDHTPPNVTLIEKSNLLLLGPSGVGKTYILSTLARVLEVPFATVDCSSLTQAGYIGTDIESSIERLLLASNHSIPLCETGIIFFDEVDKLAKPAIMTHGRDVSGEGVQQGLLKMIEGTTVTVHSKSDKSSSSSSSSRNQHNRELSGGGGGGNGKAEQYTIDTSQILFVFAGAFIGLEKIIASRLSTNTPTLGFNSSPPLSSHAKSTPSSNILSSVTPADLQAYGLIPELLGRIPILASLHALKLHELVSILTEPRNSLVKQYTALFSTYGTHGITLRFTKLALEAIASLALHGSPTSSSPSSSDHKAGTAGREKGKGDGNGNGKSTAIGARGLRSIMESILHETMFIGPSSPNIRFCLVDEEFVVNFSRQGDVAGEKAGHGAAADEEEGIVKLPRCFPRNQKRAFEEAFEAEESVWREREAKKQRERDRKRNEGAGEGEGEGAGDERGGEVRTFEEFRGRGVGSGM